MITQFDLTRLFENRKEAERLMYVCLEAKNLAKSDPIREMAADLSLRIAADQFKIAEDEYEKAYSQYAMEQAGMVTA